MTDDGQKCFAYLKENAPRWIQALGDIERHVEDKQKEMDKMPDPSLMQNSSAASIREQAITDGTTTSNTSSPRDPAQQHTSRWPTVLPKRKKNPGSISSTVASGPTKFRSRSMVVVYYNAEIQKAFEQLVRDIGIGRNLIRKGKMTARMETLTGVLNDDGVYDITDGDVPPSIELSGFRRAGERTPIKRPNSNTDGTPTAFDRADKALEKAQSFCERGAHQFLRDGDCRLEIETAKKAFEEVSKISIEELPRVEASNRSAKSRPETAGSTARPKSNDDDQGSSGMSLGPIEVDDSEEQAPINLPTLRLTSRMGPRRSPG